MQAQFSSPQLASPVGTRSVPVLIMVRELDQGGVERDVVKIAMHLDRSRFEPHVATFYAKGLRYEELRSAGVPILELPLRSLISLTSVRLANEMRRYIKQHRIQIVHAYDPSGVFGLLVARLARVPVVIGSQLSYRDILDKRTQMLLRMSDPLADAILVNCAAIRQYMIEDEHIPEERVEICYNGVDTTQFFPPKCRSTASSLVIGTVCALRPEKNLPVLQEAFAMVRGLHPKLRLVIVGSGSELKALQENAARMGIDGNEFVPATRDVPAWLRTMDIFVLPSYSEAFSNSLLEAMACGCAVVGSRVGGTPELIGSNEERGLLFESGDTKGLATQLARLILNEGLRRDLGIRAAQFAKESLSIQIAAERTAAIYDRWLLRKARRGNGIVA
jgi:glycosyltransferase involved in cell wall biosynthesis